MDDAQVGVGLGRRRRACRPRAASRRPAGTPRRTTRAPRLRGRGTRRGPASAGSPTPPRPRPARRSPRVGARGCARARAAGQRHALVEQPLVALVGRSAMRSERSAPTRVSDLDDVGVDRPCARARARPRRGGGRRARSGRRRCGRREIGGIGSPRRAALAIRSQRARTRAVVGRNWRSKPLRAVDGAEDRVQRHGLQADVALARRGPSAATTSSKGRMTSTSPGSRPSAARQARHDLAAARALEVVLGVGRWGSRCRAAAKASVQGTSASRRSHHATVDNRTPTVGGWLYCRARQRRRVRSARTEATSGIRIDGSAAAAAVGAGQGRPGRQGPEDRRARLRVERRHRRRVDGAGLQPGGVARASSSAVPGIGLQAPAILLVAFIPMLLIADGLLLHEPRRPGLRHDASRG